MKPPKVSFVIPAHNSEKILEMTLDGVIKQKYPSKMEIIVVDDHSSDNTIKVIKKFKNVRYVRNKKNLGLAGSLNIGIRASKNEVICVILDDCVIPTTGWLKKLISVLTSDDSIGIVCSPYIVPKKYLKEYNFWAKLFFLKSMKPSKDWSTYEKKELKKLSIRSAVFKREVFEKIGFFNSKAFKTGGEDVDFSLRARKAGYKIYSVNSKIFHMHGFKDYSFKDYLRKKLQYSEIKGVLIRKYGNEYSMKKCTEILYMFTFLSLVIPYLQFVGAAFLICHSLYITYLLSKEEKSYKLIYVPFARIIGDFLSIIWFFRGFITKKQTQTL